MADRTGIEWTDGTWNPVRGCSRVSEGCRFCYAEKVAARFSGRGQPYHGVADAKKPGSKWTGKIKVAKDAFDQPMRWKKPRRIFVNSMSDLFHEGLSDEQIDRVFAVMALSPQHTFQVLTKRSARMKEYMLEMWQGTPAQTLMIAGKPRRVPAGAPTGRREQVEEACDEFVQRFGLADTEKEPLWTEDGRCKALQFQWPLPNVWLGVSVENQAAADERIPDLLSTPAAKRFLSCEPLLGQVDLESAWHGETALDAECWGDCGWCSKGYPPLHNCQRGQQPEAEFDRGRSGIDWVICGGESGPGARPMHPDWARLLRDQCKSAEVPFFFKQWGEWAPLREHVVATGTELERMAASRSGKWWPDGDMQRVGKKAAGRLLDGREHIAWPA